MYSDIQSLAKLASALAQPTALLQPAAKVFVAEATTYTVRSAKLSGMKLDHLNSPSVLSKFIITKSRHTCNFFRTVL
jgi:hypothetical protein